MPRGIPCTLDGIFVEFENRIKKTPTCWVWTGSVNASGYGVFNMWISERAHRLSYFLHRGNIPTGMCVCHTCDNRKCVNPDHLFLGTRNDNNKDAARKGRMGRKLTLQDAEEVKRLYANGKRQSDIAIQFGISKTMVSLICAGRYWRSRTHADKYVGRRGCRSHVAKFDAEQVRNVRDKFATGEYSMRALAREYNVSHSAISRIVNRRSYREIP